MNNADRDWRDSNAPQWAKDAAQAEIDAYRMTAALSWPTEIRPEPMPFRWADYDKLIGDPIPGTYWSPRFSINQVEIAPNDQKVNTWKSWVFKVNDGD